MAKVLKEQFGTPYVVGTPIGKAYQSVLCEALWNAAKTGTYEQKTSDLKESKIAVIGEGVTSCSLAQAIELEYGKGVKVLCATEYTGDYLRKKDCCTPDEEDIMEALDGIEVVIADPLYRPLLPETIRFLSLPSESFSGRSYRNEIPNLIRRFGQE